ncbi:hypothetical protein COCON_G00110060 [Conger conger]|uniref:Neurotransmitter-gated ion-channel ligand-binding domain-containing protein n=1 Tax=Conger conger TaxID=82655 RepID=A0A9Q1DJK8_CONCO|nr:hypothetical protein COCON_G00110060 [Conger conger]
MDVAVSGGGIAAVQSGGSLQGEYQRKLYNDLLKNYNRLERPVQNDSAPLLVELGLTLLQIIDVVGSSQYDDVIPAD